MGAHTPNLLHLKKLVTGSTGQRHPNIAQIDTPQGFWHQKMPNLPDYVERGFCAPARGGGYWARVPRSEVGCAV